MKCYLDSLTGSLKALQLRVSSTESTLEWFLLIVSSVITCVHCSSCFIIALLGFSENGSSLLPRDLLIEDLCICVWGWGRGGWSDGELFFIFSFATSIWGGDIGGQPEINLIALWWQRIKEGLGLQSVV